MWTFVIVEGYSLFHSPSYFAYRAEFYVPEQLVLDGVVLALSHCVVLGVAALSHADPNACTDKQRCVCCTDVLDTSVRVVDEVDDFFGIKCFQSLHKAFHAAPGLHRLAYIPADDFLCVAVCHHREIAEGIASVWVPNRYIRDIRHPQLVLAYGDELLHQIWICGQPVSGVRSAWMPPWNPHVQTIAGDDGLHLVPAYHILVVGTETLTIHVMQLLTAYPWVQPSYILYKLNHHFFPEPLLA